MTEEQIEKLISPNIDNPLWEQDYTRLIMSLWNNDYGYTLYINGVLTLATGGWSENEDIVENIAPIYHCLYWQKSERGGLYVYHICPGVSEDEQDNKTL